MPCESVLVKKKCSGAPVSHCSSVVEEVGDEERQDLTRDMQLS